MLCHHQFRFHISESGSFCIYSRAWKEIPKSLLIPLFQRGNDVFSVFDGRRTSPFRKGSWEGFFSEWWVDTSFLFDFIYMLCYSFNRSLKPTNSRYEYQNEDIVTNSLQEMNHVFSCCQRCGTNVSGKLELKLGGERTQRKVEVHFYCPSEGCGNHWWKDKPRFVHAINGG